MQHYFVSDVLSVGKVVSLPDNVSHHLSRVLRAQVGDSFELVDQNQQVFQAAISQINGRVVTATITSALDRNVELPVETTIVSGLSKANKPELIVQKATELGVNRVIFLPMNRSIVKWDQKAAKKLTRLNEVA
ncbi:RsmE family RNA methyltransferase, partial [Lactobacillus parabuchneri]|nr:RsmE family RNA methyltransferase [Lentilactobacillus parabuchneri]